MTDHPAVTPVNALAAELLTEARDHHSRRAGRTLVTGTSQRATLIARAEIATHDAPTAATLYVIIGQVRLYTNDDDCVLDVGHLAAIPPQRHGLTALTDAVVLLTVALR